MCAQHDSVRVIFIYSVVIAAGKLNERFQSPETEILPRGSVKSAPLLRSSPPEFTQRSQFLRSAGRLTEFRACRRRL